MNKKSVRKRRNSKVTKVNLKGTLVALIVGGAVLTSGIMLAPNTSSSENSEVAVTYSTEARTSVITESERVTELKGKVTKYLQLRSNNDVACEELARMIAKEYSDVEVDCIDDEGVRIVLSDLRSTY